ncbi:permease prefix domain 1-containing protein [Enterococcus sp. CSURQ0835]|uniref:permease prefix domain 1-containing protein n=1 Tax=Enterococcus sp. CSURQ0835 TaxID=2681394 RepID=UPI001357BA75|nr:permease prefix domain 1-containing protein [Enterococcus sp. CSURQ0835]
METIKNYLESLFSSLPDTPKVQQAKADLLQAMEDHYNELLAEGKSEHEAIGAVISEFGSVEELKEALDLENEPESAAADWEQQITEAEMLRYLAERKKAALWLGLGIAFTILSVALLISFASLGSGEIGVLAFILFVALGVGLIITAGVQFSRLGKQLNDRRVPTAVSRIAAELKENYHRSFMFSLVGGICLCVLSLFPMILVTSMGFSSGVGAAFMFLVIAAGVFLIVYGGIVQSSFTKFSAGAYFVADEDEMGPNARTEKYGSAAAPAYILQKVYWPAVLVIYFLWSFISQSFTTSWVIFVIAGVLYGVVESFVIGVKKR